MTVSWPFFIGSGKDGWLKIVDFWAKLQAYSLTFGENDRFLALSHWQLKGWMVENGRFLGQNGKPIALLFGGK